MSPVKRSPATFVVDALERVGTTFAISFLAAVLATGGSRRVGWADAAAVAGLAAVVSLITTTLVWMVAFKAISNPYVDLVYRAGITFLQNLLGTLTAAKGLDLFSFHWDKALEAALVAAGFSLLKGLIGLQNQNTLGASPLVLHPGGAKLERRATKLPLVA